MQGLDAWLHVHPQAEAKVRLQRQLSKYRTGVYPVMYSTVYKGFAKQFIFGHLQLRALAPNPAPDPSVKVASRFFC